MDISIIFVRGLLSEVKRQGVDPQPLLLRAGIDDARLSNLRETLSVEQAAALVRDAMSLTGDPGLGLSCGVHAPESMLQVFGQLMVVQSTIRGAVAALQRYAPLLAGGMTWSLLERGPWAYFACEPLVQLEDFTRYEMEYALAMAARIGRHFSPPGAELHEVHFQHAEPRYAARYRQFFRCPISFDQPTNALVFPSAHVDRPQFHDDQTLRVVLQETAEQLLSERTRQDNVVDHIRTLLHYERELSSVDVDRLARQVKLSARGLRRKLYAAGTSLSTLVDEARCRVAQEELQRPDSSIKELADRLGFSEPSSFHRAFVRWTGRTPAQYRHEAQARSDDEPEPPEH
ncbi:MAG: AraC family transcriptional regulator [Myxococcaceae bacterium]|nr:AraC family transcriptional regulator [Myxococcaceae bacterium]